MCSSCSSTPPCYVLLIFIGASLLCFAFLLFVSTSLLCFVGVHCIFSLCAIVVHWHFVVSTLVACWHLIAMCYCCPLAPPCSVLLVLVGPSLLHTLFINTSNLGTFLTPSAIYHLLVVCYCCSLTLSCWHSQCSSMPPYCALCSCCLSTPRC